MSFNMITHAKDNAKDEDKKNFKDGATTPPVNEGVARPLGSSIIKDFQSWKSTLSKNTKTEANDFLPRQRTGTSSYINEYAFISYGGDYFSGNTPENTFASGDPLNGMVANYDQWKNPTAKNIIEWSRSLSTSDKKLNSQTPSTTTESTGPEYNKDMSANTEATTTVNPPNVNSGGVVPVTDPQIMQKENETSSKDTGTNVTTGDQAVLTAKNVDGIQRRNAGAFGSGGSIQGIGNFKYDWKDFSFCKNYGKIPNNRLLTLRRFKLPVLDNGVVSAKPEMIEKLNKSVLSPGQSPEDWTTSDSARALTYFGDGTSNSLDGIFGFTVGLNWTDFQTGTDERPDYNNNVSGQNFLTSPQDGLALLQKLGFSFGVGSDSVIAGGALMALPPTGVDGNKENLNEAARFNNLSNDPFKGGWQYRVYGPINVITKTKRRTRGLSFTRSEISLTFEYDLTQVGTLNPKVAFLDIISNMLALCYNSGSFWGGDYRFKRETTNLPLPDEIRDALEKMQSGQEVNYGDIIKKILTYGEEKFKNILTETQKFSTDIIDGLDASESATFKTISKKGKNKTPEDLKLEKELQDKIDNQIKINNTNVQALLKNGDITDAIMSKVKQVLSPLGIDPNAFLAKIATGTNKMGMIITNSILGNTNKLEDLSAGLMKLNPLATGEPVGEWHLTVGNPMNPIAVIGNLICTGMKMSMGEELGHDDFPTSLTFTIGLDHARDRDKGDIESMFNMGQGRFYLNIPGTQPWETGFSTGNTKNDSSSLSKADEQGQKS